MATITLPDAELSLMREQIRREYCQADAAKVREYYAHLVHVISHPAAVARGRLVAGTNRLQSALNLIIFWQRSSLALAVCFGLLGIIVSPWFLSGCIAIVGVTWMLNAVQTRLNLEIAARLFVLDQTMDKNPGLLETIEQDGT